MYLKTCVLVLLFIIRLWSKKHKNVYDLIRNHHGIDTSIIYRRWEKTLKQIKKVELDLKFLETCKTYQVIPKFLRFKLHRKNLQSSDFYFKWQNKLLVNEIKCKKRALAKVNETAAHQWISMQNVLSPLEFWLASKHTTFSANEFEKLTQETHGKKLQALGVKNNIAPCDPESNIQL